MRFNFHPIGILLEIVKTALITLVLAVTVPGVTVWHAFAVFAVLEIAQLKVETR